MVYSGRFGALRIPPSEVVSSLRAMCSTAARAVVNETAPACNWPGEDPVGRTIRYYPRETSPSIRIVGVVGDVRSMGPATRRRRPSTTLRARPRPGYADARRPLCSRSWRSDGHDSRRTSGASAVDPGAAAGQRCPMSTVVSGAGQSRFTTIVMTFFAGVAFFLAALDSMESSRMQWNSAA